MGQNIIDAINKEASADEIGVASCLNVLNGNKSLKFDLGNITIILPYSRLYSKQSKNPNYCATVVKNTYATHGDQNLGVPFVEQIYLASSFDSDKFGIAPVKHPHESNIVDFNF